MDKLLDHQWRSQRDGNFKRLHDSIKPPIWSRRFVAKFVWIQFGSVGCGSRLRCVHPRTVGARYASPHSPNWIQTYLADRGGPNLLAWLNHVHRGKRPPPPGCATDYSFVQSVLIILPSLLCNLVVTLIFLWFLLNSARFLTEYVIGDYYRLIDD